MEAELLSYRRLTTEYLMPMLHEGMPLLLTASMQSTILPGSLTSLLGVISIF